MGFFDNAFKAITEDECVKDPVMHAIGAGTTVALLHFLGTGLTLRSITVFCLVMVPVGVGSSMLCTYNQRVNKLKAVYFRDAMKYRALTEGTDMDPSFVNSSEDE